MWRLRWRRIRATRGNVLRLIVAQHADRAWTLTRRRLLPEGRVDPFDGRPRFALLTVNFHTTRYLKLMLLTLSEQAQLGLVHRIVVCDNGSRDGGPEFLRALSQVVDRLELVEHRHFLNHGRGLRSCVVALERAESLLPSECRSNLLLFCDTDVVFRNPETLLDLAGMVLAHDAALVGEIRQGAEALPDIQASFFVLRRDCYARRDIAPILNAGSPAYRMQRSVWSAGLVVAPFPSNRGGYVLHRGRSAISATREFAPRNPWVTERSEPHFMGTPGGAKVWGDIEARWASLLEPTEEPRLLELLSDRFRQLGEVVVEPG